MWTHLLGVYPMELLDQRICKSLLLVDIIEKFSKAFAVHESSNFITNSKFDVIVFVSFQPFWWVENDVALLFCISFNNICLTWEYFQIFIDYLHILINGVWAQMFTIFSGLFCFFFFFFFNIYAKPYWAAPTTSLKLYI